MTIQIQQNRNNCVTKEYILQSTETTTAYRKRFKTNINNDTTKHIATKRNKNDTKNTLTPKNNNNQNQQKQ